MAFDFPSPPLTPGQVANGYIWDGEKWNAIETVGGDVEFDTRAQAVVALISSTVNVIQLMGYHAAGDGGGATYKRVVALPAGAFGFQSADGAWWQLAETVFNVRMFGAKGDGVALDTAAIMAAYNAGVAAGGADILIPPGTFLVDNMYPQANRSNGIHFRGAGSGLTIVKLKPGAASQGIFMIRYADNVSVSDMTLLGHGGSGINDPLVYFVECTNAAIERCQMRNFMFCGAGFNGVSPGAIRDNEIARAAISAAENYGILVLSVPVPRSRDIVIAGNIVRNTQIQIYDTDYAVIASNVVNSVGFGACIGVGYGKTNIVANNILSNTSGTDINGVAVSGIENISNETTIIGNTISNTAGAGIGNFGAKCVISGNTIIDVGNVTSGPSKNSFGIINADVGDGQKANGTLVIGNTVKNSAGVTGEYGYGENVTAMTGIQVLENNFEGMALGPLNISPASATLVSSPMSVAYTPVITPGSGIYTNVTATGAYIQRGKQLTVDVTISYTNIGTGAGSTAFTLPRNAVGPAMFVGVEVAVTGQLLIGHVNGAGPVVFRKSADSAPFVPANGHIIVASGTYRIA